MKVQKIDVFASISFIILIGLSVAGQKLSKTPMTLDLLPIVTTLFATYIGAKLAFIFQARKEELESIGKHITAGNLAIFQISIMVSELYSYQSNIINKHREDPFRFLSIQPTVNKTDTVNKLQLEPLSFLFNSSELNLVGELAAAQSHFFSIGETIASRSLCHQLEIQPLLEKAAIHEGEIHELSHIKKILGERLFHTIVKATDDVIEHTDSNIDSLVKIAARLTAELKVMFPSASILALKDPRSATEQKTTL